jgi:hypothetical protein
VPGMKVCAPRFGIEPDTSTASTREKVLPVSTSAAVASPAACKTEPGTPNIVTPEQILPATRSVSTSARFVAAIYPARTTVVVSERLTVAIVPVSALPATNATLPSIKFMLPVTDLSLGFHPDWMLPLVGVPQTLGYPPHPHGDARGWPRGLDHPYWRKLGYA